MSLSRQPLKKALGTEVVSQPELNDVFISDGLRADGERSLLVYPLLPMFDISWLNTYTGNVQIDPRHLATCHDRTIFSTSALTIASYAQLHSTILSSVPTGYSEPLTLMQISHPGLQSSSTLGLCRLPWARAVAPCSARPDTGNSAMGWLIGRLVWPLRSRRLDDVEEWLQIVEGFVRAAQIAEKSGWKGVQVHSAHGYLLAEYLSPLVSRGWSNLRRACRNVWPVC